MLNTGRRGGEGGLLDGLLFLLMVGVGVCSPILVVTAEDLVFQAQNDRLTHIPLLAVLSLAYVSHNLCPTATLNGCVFAGKSYWEELGLIKARQTTLVREVSQIVCVCDGWMQSQQNNGHGCLRLLGLSSCTELICKPNSTGNQIAREFSVRHFTPHSSHMYV